MNGLQPDWKPAGDGRTEADTRWRGRKQATRRIRALGATRRPLDELPAPIKAIAVRWARKKSTERRVETLMVGISVEERAVAEQALDLLLERGWIQIVERYADNCWRRAAVSFVDLGGLRESLRISNETALWREAAIRVLGAGERATAICRQVPLKVPGLDHEAVLRRLSSLPEMVAKERRYLRTVAASLFGGRSKVLDGREGLICAVLGMSSCPFPEVPIRLDIVVPPIWDETVLFIENPLALEALSRTHNLAANGSLLVLAQGFMASARRVRDRRTTSVYARTPANGGHTQRFESWLFRETDEVHPVFFWGDLDYAGMNILKELRVVFPEMRAWELGYAPMVSAVRAGDGHPPDEADKENQLDPGNTGCTYADRTLLPAMRETGLFYDQEGVIQEFTPRGA